MTEEHKNPWENDPTKAGTVPAEEEAGPAQETFQESVNETEKTEESPALKDAAPVSEAEPPVPTVEEPVIAEKEAEPVSTAEKETVENGAEPVRPEQQFDPAAGQPFGQPPYGPQYGEQPYVQPQYYYPQQSAPGYVPAQPGYQGYPQAGYYQQPYYQPVNQPSIPGQPIPGQPVPGYPVPGNGAVYQTPYYPNSKPPKKKMSTGLKVFIWVASILAGLAVIGFGIYFAMNAGSPGTLPSLPNNDFSERLPWEERPKEDDGEDSDVPKFDDGVVPPEDKDEDSKPDVDVTPNTEGITIEKKPSGQELSAKEVYSKVVKSTVTVAVSLEREGMDRPQTSTGTGIIATSDGYIITNAHVVLNSKSSSVKITTYDGSEYDAVVVGADRTTDLAILKMNDHDFTPAEFGDVSELVIGDSVIAIGNPGGEKFSGSMTGGYISGLDRLVGKYSENGMTYIQTDAAINPGNSGGPLVNMYGQVVGINSSKIVTEGYEGMGFAIPVSTAKPIIDELLSGGYVKGRVRLGITGRDVSAEEAAFYRVPQGFVISEIGEESAFIGTDAQEGDIITAIDGEEVTCLSEISNLLLKYSPGDKITVTLYRQNGETEDVEITLLEDKGETQK